VYTITCDLLRQALDPHVAGFRCEPIKAGGKPSRLDRVWLSYAAPTRAPASIVVKRIGPDWPRDPRGADREFLFCTQLLPQLDIAAPRLYDAKHDAATGYRLLLMEDLAPKYRFPPPTHAWTPAEARCLLRAYAMLHARGREAVPPATERDWLWPSQEELLLGEEVPRAAHGLAQQPFWRAVPGLDALIAWTRAFGMSADRPTETLLHGDLYPPNAGLPHDLDDEAVLIDWEMAAVGPAELELAYMFLQPHHAERNLVRDDMLAYYWAQREAIEGRVPSPDERCVRQRYADAVLALALLPVAHKVAVRPYPLGSSQAVYWDNMFGILNRRLHELADEIVGGTT